MPEPFGDHKACVYVVAQDEPSIGVANSAWHTRELPPHVFYFARYAKRQNLMAFTRQVDKAALLAEFDRTLEAVRSEDHREVPRLSDIAIPQRRVFPILYLPVEVKAREFQAKAAIAREAAACGMTVVLGAKWPMILNLDAFPHGIFMFKTLNQTDAVAMLRCVEYGHLTAALDEEMFGISASSSYIGATVHPHAVACADLICAQGPSYAEHFPYQADIKVTGALRTKTYKTPQSDDILVCLQTGNINNNGRSFEEMIVQTLQLSAYPLSSSQGQIWADILRTAIAHECDVLPLVSETIAALAKAFPDRRIVLRPHPVEDPSNWDFSAPNIVFDEQNDIVNSLEHAGAAVFVSGCTTGLDAFLANVPAVRLGRGGIGISAHMHTEAATPDEAIAAVRRGKAWKGALDQHLAPLNLTSHLVALYKANAAAAGTGSFRTIPY